MDSSKKTEKENKEGIKEKKEKDDSEEPKDNPDVLPDRRFIDTRCCGCLKYFEKDGVILCSDYRRCEKCNLRCCKECAYIQNELEWICPKTRCHDLYEKEMAIVSGNPNFRMKGKTHWRYINGIPVDYHELDTEDGGARGSSQFGTEHSHFSAGEDFDIDATENVELGATGSSDGATGYSQVEPSTSSSTDFNQTDSLIDKPIRAYEFGCRNITHSPRNTPTYLRSRQMSPPSKYPRRFTTPFLMDPEDYPPTHQASMNPLTPWVDNGCEHYFPMDPSDCGPNNRRALPRDHTVNTPRSDIRFAGLNIPPYYDSPPVNQPRNRCQSAEPHSRNLRSDHYKRCSNGEAGSIEDRRRMDWRAFNNIQSSNDFESSHHAESASTSADTRQLLNYYPEQCAPSGQEYNPQEAHFGLSRHSRLTRQRAIERNVIDNNNDLSSRDYERPGLKNEPKPLMRKETKTGQHVTEKQMNDATSFHEPSIQDYEYRSLDRRYRRRYSIENVENNEPSTERQSRSVSRYSNDPNNEYSRGKKILRRQSRVPDLPPAYNLANSEIDINDYEQNQPFDSPLHRNYYNHTYSTRNDLRLSSSPKSHDIQKIQNHESYDDSSRYGRHLSPPRNELIFGPVDNLSQKIPKQIQKFYYTDNPNASAFSAGHSSRRNSARYSRTSEEYGAYSRSLDKESQRESSSLRNRRSQSVADEAQEIPQRVPRSPLRRLMTIQKFEAMTREFTHLSFERSFESGCRSLPVCCYSNEHDTALQKNVRDEREFMQSMNYIPKPAKKLSGILKNVLQNKKDNEHLGYLAIKIIRFSRSIKLVVAGAYGLRHRKQAINGSIIPKAYTIGCSPPYEDNDAHATLVVQSVDPFWNANWSLPVPKNEIAGYIFDFFVWDLQETFPRIKVLKGMASIVICESHYDPRIQWVPILASFHDDIDRTDPNSRRIGNVYGSYVALHLHDMEVRLESRLHGAHVFHPKPFAGRKQPLNRHSVRFADDTKKAPEKKEDKQQK